MKMLLAALLCALLLASGALAASEHAAPCLVDDELVLKPGEKLRIVADDSPVPCWACVYESSDRKVASVTATGVVRGRAAGEAVVTVRAKEGGAALACRVAVSGGDIVIPYGRDGSAAFDRTLDALIANLSSSAYDPDLSCMLMSLAAAAYNDPDAGPEAADELLDKGAASVANISGAFRALGFDDPAGGAAYQLFNYYKGDAAAYGSDNAAFALGRRRMSNGETLALIVVRGTHCVSDWDSNYRVDTTSGGAHCGFDAAAGKVFAALTDFLGGLPTAGVRYVITGHSRGAAVANLLAVRLHDAGVPNARVYDYNFACPDVARRVSLLGLAWRGGHENMFNICNTADLVCAVPGALGDVTGAIRDGTPFTAWGKYGKTLYFSRSEPRAYERVLNTALRPALFGDSTSSHAPMRYVDDMRKLPTHFLTRAEAALRRYTLGRLWKTEDQDRLARWLRTDACD